MPPETLTPAALTEFHRLVACLRRIGTLDKTDPNIVVTAARLQSLINDSFDKIAEEGLTAVGGHGTPIAHPLAALLNSYATRMSILKRDMGLTASTAKHGTPTQSESADDGNWSDLLTVTA